MEPTIYKPSIYKGAGIYKIGANGGGGGFTPPERVLIGSNYYPIRKYNNKYWMVDNLFEVVDASKQRFFDNDQMFKFFGAYYQLDDGLISQINTAFSPWRLPTKEDFDELFEIAENNAEKFKTDFGWREKNGTNALGFNAYPVNRYFPNSNTWQLDLYKIGECVRYWTSTKDNSQIYAANFTFQLDSTNYIKPYQSTDGYCVRLIKDA